MTNSAASVARQLLYARSTSERVAILAGAPQIDPASIVEVCRHPAPHGFSDAESAWLKANADRLSLALRAVAGELSPDIPADLYGMVGMAFRMQGDFDRARQFYKYAFSNAANPGEQAAAVVSLGILEFQEHKLAEAEATLKRARELAERNSVRGPTLPSVVNNLGLIAREKGDLGGALSLFEEAGQLAHQERVVHLVVDSRLNLASAALEARQFARGIAALDSIHLLIENSTSPKADAYQTLRRDLEAGGQQRGAVVPPDLAALFARASADSALLLDLHRRLLEARGSFEELAEAILAPDGPLRGLRPDGNYRVVQVLREAAKERGSAGALAETVLHLCQFGEASPSDCIVWLQDALQQNSNVGVPTTAVAAVVRARLHDALGDQHFRRLDADRADDLKAAIYHWSQALRYLESGRVGDKKVAEIVEAETIRGALVRTHFKLGLGLNALLTVEGGDPEAAIGHFQAALDNLSNQPANAGLRAELMNNLGNALAYKAASSLSRATFGQRDRTALLRSLDLQSANLEAFRTDPVSRFETLINMIQTYRELCDLGPYAAREYLDAAAQCLDAARSALAEIPDPPPDLEASFADKEAHLAIDRDLPSVELLPISATLGRVLRLADRISHPGLVGSLFSAAAKIEERLGNKPRSYRRLLSGLACLYSGFDAAAGQAAARAVVLTGMHGELIRRLLAWNDPRRALFFVNLERSRAWSAAGGVRRCLPRSGSWACLPNQVAVEFHMNLEEAVAFVVTPEGVRSHPYDFRPIQLLQLGARWLTATMEARTPAESGAAATAWEAAIDGVSEHMGQMLFAPLAPMLPARGELTVAADQSMDVMPLHLARLEPGTAPSRLMERFAVHYCDYLDFWANDAGASAGRESVFVAAYSPPEARLPFAALESAAITAARKGQAETALGEDATPDAVLGGIETHRVVHLCCHGSWAWDDPLESTLTLAGRALTLREITLRLEHSPCELIVLSACEVGMRTSGGDGPGGFARILLRAGCQAFLGALWRVDDLATALLVGRFYEEWTGAAAGAAAALCRAQGWLAEQTGDTLAARARSHHEQTRSTSDVDADYIEARLNELARSGDGRPFAHPKYWGAFCVSERARSLVRSRNLSASLQPSGSHESPAGRV